METRLARILQDVKTTRSDIAEVLFYLRNQPSSIVRRGTKEHVELQSTQGKNVQNDEDGLISGGDTRVAGKGSLHCGQPSALTELNAATAVGILRYILNSYLARYDNHQKYTVAGSLQGPSPE